jgi:CheY-like chemotaxis protein
MALILIVDDEPDILALLHLQLDRVGHETLAASSGRDALDLLCVSARPDLAILDVRMPGMNGYELVRELRARGFEDMPVIFLSARAEPEYVELGGSMGALYMTKPYFSTDLLKAIDDIAA